MKTRVRTLVGVALFGAIVVVLQMLGGGIRFGMFSISLVLVPIVVGAAVYGVKAGALLGLVFGIAVLWSGDAGAFMAVDPLGTVIVVLAKGVLCGLCSGVVYTLMCKRSRILAVICAAVVCPVVNTGVFLLGCRIFFFDTVAQWAASFGYPNAAQYMFFGLAGVNFLIELSTNIVLAPVITRLIRAANK